MSTHSPLGASGAERWMNCPGSVNLIKSMVLPESDEEDYQLLAKRILEPEGLVVHCAETWKEGRPLLESVRPGLLILDINVPDADGYSTEAYLKFARDADTRWPMVIIRNQP